MLLPRHWRAASGLGEAWTDATTVCHVPVTGLLLTVHRWGSCEVPEAYSHYPKLHLLVRFQFSEGGSGAHAHQHSLVQSTD